MGGSLSIGDQVLRKGDGFFVPEGAAYAYTAGPEGVEVLEFRHAPIEETTIQANNPAYWEKAAETARARAVGWLSEPRPSDVAGQATSAKVDTGFAIRTRSNS